MDTSGWSGVRCVFRHTTFPEPVFEERVTLWQTADLDEALARAERDAGVYAENTEAEYLGLAQAYALDDRPGDGAEVFSLLRTSPLEPSDYLDRFFDTGLERQAGAG